MRPIEACSRWIGLVALLVSASSAPGQEPSELSADKRAALIGQRDALANQAIGKANQGDFEDAQMLFDQVFRVEKFIFGEAHEELLGTLDYQIQIANAAEDWDSVVEFRRRAHKIGKALYPEGDFRSRDLAFTLEEARRNVTRTDQQRRLLVQATAITRQVVALYQSGRFAEAIGSAKQVSDIREQVLGKEHPEYAGSLNNLAALYKSMGDYTRAEPLYLEAKKIQEKVLGKDHPEYANILSSLAGLYYSMVDYARAEPLYAEARKIREKTLGKEHPSYATTLNNLALLYKSMGEYARAEPLFLEAKTIREKMLGKEHPDYATSLNNLALLYHSMGDFAKAELLYLEANKIRENVLGTEHPDYATSLNNLALVYQSIGDYARAKPLFHKSKTIREKVLGKEHPDYAASLNNLAALYQSMGDYARTESLYLEAKAILEKAFGKEHPDYAQNLDNLAGLYDSMSDYARAEPLYLEAKTIREKLLGKEHPDYAQSLNNLAMMYVWMGDYAQAEFLFLEAHAIHEKVLGKEHRSYAASLNNLAVLYQSMGDYKRAEPLYVEAKAIYEKVIGKEHASYAGSLNNLAALYELMGDYAQAEPLYLEAKAIDERVLGKEHPKYANNVHNLAGLYQSMGDYERAEPLYLEAKAIRKKWFGKEHPDYAGSLNNLAGLYESMGDYTRAEPLYIEVKAIYEQLLGKEHPSYATSLNNLAHLYYSMDDYARAEPLYVEAKTILEKVFGREHPHYAQSLNNLAGLYLSMGEYARAEPLYLKAKMIRERALGTEHPHYAGSLNNLAALYESMGDDARAEPLFRHAIEITQKHLDATAYAQSEQQQLLMSQSVRYKLDNYLDCCVDGDLNPDHVIKQLILGKGSILRRGRNLRRAASDPAIAEVFQELQSVASQLSAAVRTIPSPEKLEARKTLAASLAEKKRQLEVELSRRSGDFRDAIQPVKFDQIRQSIPADSVLIDFREYVGKRGRSLAASVIRRNGELVLLDLGSAENAGKAIDAWRESYGMTAEAKAAGRALRKQVWQPLLEHVYAADLILVSTDGVLGRLPLAALPGAKPNTFLIEDHRLALAPVPQLLPGLGGKQGSEKQSRELLVMGDVDYGQSETAKWPNLAETGREINLIKNLFTQSTKDGDKKVTELRASEATESAFLDASPKCEMIHLATHGFFEGEDKVNALSSHFIAKARGVGGFVQLFAPTIASERKVADGFSPGQLSGLVFANANQTARSDKRFSRGEFQDDGIMTADEIAYLPLEKTKLAVLSACETGLGEVAGGEGLIGIQRAFQIAGADSVVATMWKVDDVMTRKLMERFYTNFFVDKMSKLDALREAQLWVLRSPYLVEQSDDRGAVRKRKDEIQVTGTDSEPRTNPYYWAPFVLSGDWR